jgi:hypothetical protein
MIRFRSDLFLSEQALLNDLKMHWVYSIFITVYSLFSPRGVNRMLLSSFSYFVGIFQYTKQ